MAKLGASPEQIASQRALMQVQAQVAEQGAGLDKEPDEEAFVCWAWHLDAMLVFDAMQTQVRVASGPAGLVWVGLDLAALPQVWEELDMPAERRTPVLRRQLRVLEAEAVLLLNRRRE